MRPPMSPKDNQQSWPDRSLSPGLISFHWFFLKWTITLPPSGQGSPDLRQKREKERQTFTHHMLWSMGPLWEKQRSGRVETSVTDEQWIWIRWSILISTQRGQNWPFWLPWTWLLEDSSLKPDSYHNPCPSFKVRFTGTHWLPGSRVNFFFYKEFELKCLVHN